MPPTHSAPVSVRSSDLPVQLDDSGWKLCSTKAGWPATLVPMVRSRDGARGRLAAAGAADVTATATAAVASTNSCDAGASGATRAAGASLADTASCLSACAAADGVSGVAWDDSATAASVEVDMRVEESLPLTRNRRRAGRLRYRPSRI